MKFIPSRPFSETERERERASKRALMKARIQRRKAAPSTSRYNKPATEVSKRINRRILGESD